MNLNQATTLCRSFPGATEDIKWVNQRVFSVGGKMFALTRADADTGLCFKVEAERFLELTDRPGIVPAPYLARMKWVQVQDGAALGDAEAAQLLRRAYELVRAKLTKKLQRELSEKCREGCSEG
jgi:predicted DNA-binding protein (MmcQ/YjbR family)